MSEDVERRVVEELSEELSTLKLDGRTREEKQGMERAAYAGEPEVEFFEESFARRRLESVEDVRRAVDGLAFVARPLAKYRAPEATVAAPPQPAKPREPQLTANERAAVERVIGPALKSARLVTRNASATAVEVRIARNGREDTEVLLVRDGAVVTVDDATRKMESFEPKRATPAAPQASPAPRPEAQAASPPKAEEKSSRFKLPFAKKKDGAAEPGASVETKAPEPAPAAPDVEPAKGSRFKLPKFGKKKE
ncbi:MAG: hypothetical protein ACYDCK_11235 [Thermoplasmatota archaeon]